MKTPIPYGTYKNKASLTIENLLPLELYALKEQLTKELGSRINTIVENDGALTITLWRGERTPDGGAREHPSVY